MRAKLKSPDAFGTRSASSPERDSVTSGTKKIATAAPADKDRLAGDASNAMKKAVTDQGLSVEEYSSILRVAQNDPGIRDRLLQRLHPSAQ